MFILPAPSWQACCLLGTFCSQSSLSLGPKVLCPPTPRSGLPYPTPYPWTPSSICCFVNGPSLNVSKFAPFECAICFLLGPKLPTLYSKHYTTLPRSWDPENKASDGGKQNHPYIFHF